MFCRSFSFGRDFLVFDNLPLIEAGEAGFLDSRALPPFCGWINPYPFSVLSG
jgi:hypothetical protein